MSVRMSITRIIQSLYSPPSQKGNSTYRVSSLGIFLIKHISKNTYICAATPYNHKLCIVFSLLRINIRSFTWSFRFLFMVFNATFNNISVISQQSVLPNLLTRRVPLVEQELITLLQVLCVCCIDRCLSFILLASVLSVLL